jgi:hypothetical protein
VKPATGMFHKAVMACRSSHPTAVGPACVVSKLAGEGMGAGGPAPDCQGHQKGHVRCGRSAAAGSR